MKMHSASEVARWFLSRNNQNVLEDGGELISNLKLQKLLYYAQGTYLAITDTKLFNDPIVAWQHGPVVQNVYNEYRVNGSNGIENFEPIDLNNFDEETNEILEAVYQNFGQYSAWKLREKTHNETPWKETKRNDEIKTESIKEYFLKEYII